MKQIKYDIDKLGFEEKEALCRLVGVILEVKKREEPNMNLDMWFDLMGECLDEASKEIKD